MLLSISELGLGEGPNCATPRLNSSLSSARLRLRLRLRLRHMYHLRLNLDSGLSRGGLDLVATPDSVHGLA